MVSYQTMVMIPYFRNIHYLHMILCIKLVLWPQSKYLQFISHTSSYCGPRWPAQRKYIERNFWNKKILSHGVHLHKSADFRKFCDDSNIMCILCFFCNFHYFPDTCVRLFLSWFQQFPIYRCS